MRLVYEEVAMMLSRDGNPYIELIVYGAMGITMLA